MSSDEGLPTPEIMYVCDCCAEHNPEMCGKYKREDVRFLASGNQWLCQSCFEDESEDDWDVATMAPVLVPLVTGRECVAGKALGGGDPATVKVIAALQECDYELTTRALTPADTGVERLREALEPSLGTKRAYMGEFQFGLPDWDEYGNEVMRNVDVPWTTIKEIMAAIRARAATDKGEE